MKRLSNLLLALLILSVLVSCRYDYTINNMIVNDTLNLSFVKETDRSRVNPNAYKIEVGPGIQYKEGIESGTLEFSVTPDVFYMSINNIALYNAENPSDITSGAVHNLLDDVSNALRWLMVNEDGGFVYMSSNEVFPIFGADVLMSGMGGDSPYVPSRVNMLYTKGISASYSNVGNKTWNGLFFDLFQGDMGDNFVNNVYSGSMVGIKKTVLEAKGIHDYDIANRLMNISPSVDDADEYVWFTNSVLNPFADTEYDQQLRILFQTGITEPVVYRFDEVDAEGDTQAIFGPGLFSAGRFFIGLPMNELDSSDLKNPEVEFCVDAENLIQFYSYGGKYYAYFNKDNPYPYSISMKEYEVSTIADSEEDVSSYSLVDCFRFLVNDLTVLQWARPNYADVKRILIYSSKTNDFSTATYLGSTRSCDYIISGKDYWNTYYWAVFENSKGERSQVKQFVEFIR